MLKLKTKWFNKWAKKNSVEDESLLAAIDNINNNLGTADLGAGLYKVRTAKTGQGKRGSFRTIVVFKKHEVAVFIYGFSKNEKDNLSNDETKYFKKLAKDLLAIDKEKYQIMIELEEFINIKE